MVVVFFFKQKTAYEMRISDWSSDVCSSDLLSLIDGEAFAQGADAAPDIRLDLGVAMFALVAQRLEHVGDHIADFLELGDAETARGARGRTDADAAGLDRRQRVEGDAIQIGRAPCRDSVWQYR